MADDDRRTDDLWFHYVPSWPELEAIFMERLDMSPEEFRELTDEAKGWAFSVARIENATVLRRAKEKLGQIIREGRGAEEFIAWVEGSGFQWSEAYSTLVARMAVLPTYGLARYQEIAKPESAENFAYIMYDAINDNRVRPEHLAMDNRVWRRDQFPWEWTPPNGYNCRCSIRQLDDYLLRRSGGVLQNETGAPVLDGQQLQPDKGFRANQMESFATMLEAKRQEAEDGLRS